MSSILQRLRAPSKQRHNLPSTFTFNGAPHQLGQFQLTLPGSPAEGPSGSFESFVSHVHDGNGVVAAAVAARAYVVSQVNFAWRSDIDRRLFTDRALRPVQRPGPNLSRSTMLFRAEQDACYHGNYFARILPNGNIKRLRPDWVQVVIGTNEDVDHPAHASDAEIVGFVYYPGGLHTSTAAPIRLTTSEVIHWVPEPHPLHQFIGRSPVLSVLSEIIADGQATNHVQSYFEHAATANMVVKTPPEVVTPDQFTEWVDFFVQEHEGQENAWKNIFLGAGSEVQVVGSSLADLSIQDLQGGMETRVASRLRVPAVILQIREGMQGSALNSGNYSATRRQWADGWFSPHADSLCASFEKAATPRPAASSLSYDPSFVMLLQEDRQDEADIIQRQATAIRTLNESGYDPDASVDSVVTADLSKLQGRHTGLQSVQLVPPGEAEVQPQGEES